MDQGGLILPPGVQRPAPQQAPDAGSVESLVDLYDSDILVIEEVFKRIQASEGQSRDMEGFRLEVVERFAEAGFKVDCRMWSSDVPGVYLPEIVIQDRMKPTPFDHSRQSWEVQNDILDIEGGGVVIKGNGVLGTPSKTVGLSS